MYPVYKKLGTVENCEEIEVAFPLQHQDQQPGMEYLMNPRPISENPYIKGRNICDAHTKSETML